MIRKIAVAMLCLAAIFSIIGGARYLMTQEFMPYHATVVGKNWAQIEPGIQSIILGMLKIVGGGFLATGIAIIFFLIPIRRGETWACWATLSVAAANWVPTQYVTFALRSVAPTAKTPVVLTAIILVLVVVGIAMLLFVRAESKNGKAYLQA